MKHYLFALVCCLLLVACSNNDPKDLSVKGHTYFASFDNKISDDIELHATATIKFTSDECYLNDEFAGKYTQNKEVVYVNKVDNYTGSQIIISTDRVYTSYGDYITFNGIVYNKIE